MAMSAASKGLSKSDMPIKLPLCAGALLTAAMLVAPAIPQTPAASDHAQADAMASPVGCWKTFDDKTGEAKSIVAIHERKAVLYGRIEQVFHPPVPHPLCIRCSGDLKNKPVVGLQILWGMRKDDKEWSGGRVLDPESGDVYRATMKLEDGGKVLLLRGYIGFSIFGRTEKWVRVEGGKRLAMCAGQ